MYKLIPTQSVPFNPAPLRVGLPEMEHTNPNLIIISSNNSNYLAVNATVLREALLNSSELLKEALGLEVKDLRKKSVPSQNTSKLEEPKKKKVSKTKETSTSEEPILVEEVKEVSKVETPSEDSKEEDEWV